LVWGGELGEPFDPTVQPRQIAPNADYFGSARWSPDGTQIAYLSNETNAFGGATGAIWVVNADGTGDRRITSPVTPPLDRQTDPREFDTGVAWAPDGRHLAFTRIREESCGDDNCAQVTAQLRVTSVDGGDGTVISERVAAPTLAFEQEILPRKEPCVRKCVLLSSA
jgi:Tol biopolymer transport system component